MDVERVEEVKDLGCRQAPPPDGRQMSTALSGVGSAGKNVTRPSGEVKISWNFENILDFQNNFYYIFGRILSPVNGPR